MLSFRVVKKLQRDVLLVHMEQSEEKGVVADTTSGGKKKLHLLRILTLPAKESTTLTAAGEESQQVTLLLLRSKDKLLKELSSFRSVSRERADYFCRPDHASVQLLPAPTHNASGAQQGEAECQVHLFASVDCPVGLFQHSLAEAKHFLPKDEETGWRLLASLAQALHTLHFAPPTTNTAEDSSSSHNHRPFYSYYGLLSDKDVSVYTTGSGRSFRYDAPEYLDSGSIKMLGLDRGGVDRSHVLQFALDVPTSVFYKTFAPQGGGSNHNASTQTSLWASEDIKAVGTIVKNCCSDVVSVDPATGSTTYTMGSHYSQEFRFLLDKMCQPDASTRPSASQILSFQAVALRLRSWQLQQTVEQQQREISRLQHERDDTSRTNQLSTASSIPVRSSTPEQVGGVEESPGGATAELRLRLERVAHREAKVQLFLELYNLTTSQLDQMPSSNRPVNGAGNIGATGEAAIRRNFEHHLQESTDVARRTQQQQQQQQQSEFDPHHHHESHIDPTEVIRPSNAAGRSASCSPASRSRPGSGSGSRHPTNNSSTPIKPQSTRTHQAPSPASHLTYEQHSREAPPSPELSPFPKQSDYGSHVGTPIEESIATLHGGVGVGVVTPSRVTVSSTILGPSLHSLAAGRTSPSTVSGKEQVTSTYQPQPQPLLPLEGDEICEVIEMELDSAPATPDRPYTRPDTALPPPLGLGSSSIQTQEENRQRHFSNRQEETPKDLNSAAPLTPTRQRQRHQQRHHTTAQYNSSGSSSHQHSTPPTQKQYHPHHHQLTPSSEQRNRRMTSRDRTPTNGGTPTPGRTKRSPSVKDQKVNYDWMSAHLSDLEVMQRTLNQEPPQPSIMIAAAAVPASLPHHHNRESSPNAQPKFGSVAASSTTVPGQASHREESVDSFSSSPAIGDPIVTRLMSLVQGEMSTADALHQLRAQVKIQSAQSEK